jgi:Ca2+-binding EF-hand superfamily protein
MVDLDNSSETVDFATLKNIVEIEDQNLFEVYLNEVYKDLTDRAESSKKQGIGKITFYDYMKMQIFIVDKLFSAFDQDQDGFLNHKEFMEGLMTLYFGNFKDTVKVIFSIFDFNKNGKINKGDVKITMSYLPIKETTHKGQMESLTEIDEIIEIYFKNNDTLKFEQFMNLVQTKKSDLYLQLLCFIYENKPFNKENVEACRNLKKKRTTNDLKRKGSILENKYTTGELNIQRKESVKLSSPSRKSSLLPANTFLGLNLNSTDDGEDVLIEVPHNPFPHKKGVKINDDDLKNVIRINTNKEGKNLDSPSKYLKKEPDIGGEDFSISLKGSNKKKSTNDLTPTKKNSVFTYSDWVFKITENGNLKKYFLNIIGKDIYYYKSELKDELQGMHNLTGCFVKDKSDEKIMDNKKFYGFSIIFSNKVRTYYTIDKKDREDWVISLKTSIGYQTFTDTYDLQGDLGEGKFGLVKLGIHKKTQEKVAIKIIKKDSMDQKDLELVRSEIDIMKLCKHKNIVRLLDHYENNEYIFIVMEYLAGGDLGNYSKKRKYDFSEEEVRIIIYQITQGIDYLHKYGVAHRDLKPDNIMLHKKGSINYLKIMDFGLSKILGPQEKVADGFGTLSFVAPEVLVRKPYNKEVDIWSIGITLYYILTGTLPFDDTEDNEEVIAKKIVFSKLEFYDKKWKKISDTCMNYVEKTLIKEPEKRWTSKQLLNHEWFKKLIENFDSDE